jgi:hypothetical protein
MPDQGIDGPRHSARNVAVGCQLPGKKPMRFHPRVHDSAVATQTASQKGGNPSAPPSPTAPVRITVLRPSMTMDGHGRAYRDVLAACLRRVVRAGACTKPKAPSELANQHGVAQERYTPTACILCKAAAGPGAAWRSAGALHPRRGATLPGRCAPGRLTGSGSSPAWRWRSGAPRPGRRPGAGCGPWHRQRRGKCPGTRPWRRGSGWRGRSRCRAWSVPRP